MSGSWSSGRGFFGGRPRRRFVARIFPLRNIWPPHTPHGSRRAIAPSRQVNMAGHSEQIVFARAMSCSSSEKNSEVNDPSPSRHAAWSHHSGLNSSLLSDANMSGPFPFVPAPYGRLARLGCAVASRIEGGTAGKRAEKLKRPPVSRRPFGELVVVFSGRRA